MLTYLKEKLKYYLKTCLFISVGVILNIIHSILRNMCSSLNADLHLVNLKPSSACIYGHGFEDCIHFFFECSFYNENRAILFHKLENYVQTFSLLFIPLLEAHSALTNVTSILTPVQVVSFFLYVCFCFVLFFLFETFRFHTYFSVLEFLTFYFTIIFIIIV